MISFKDISKAYSRETPALSAFWNATLADGSFPLPTVATTILYVLSSRGRATTSGVWTWAQTDHDVDIQEIRRIYAELVAEFDRRWTPEGGLSD